MKRRILQSSQGAVTVEFVWMFVLFITLTFGVVELGSMLHERNVITHLVREGASIYSRDYANANTIVKLIKDSSKPLDFPSDPSRYAIFVARATAGNPPRCTETGSSGTLTEGVTNPASSSTCGLTSELFAYLKPDGKGVSKMQQFSVVRLYYKHKPLTPLAGFLTGTNFDPDPVMSSTAIF